MKELERYEGEVNNATDDNDSCWTCEAVCKSEDVAELEAKYAQLEAKYAQLMETLRLVVNNMKHTTQPVWDAQKDDWELTYEYRLPTVVGRQVTEVYDRIFVKEFLP